MRWQQLFIVYFILSGISPNVYAQASWIEQLQCAAQTAISNLPPLGQLAEDVHALFGKGSHRYRIDRMAEGETNLAKLIGAKGEQPLYEQIYIDFPRARIEISLPKYSILLLPEMSKSAFHLETAYRYIAGQMQKECKLDAEVSLQILHHAYAYLTQTFDFDAMKEVRTLASTNLLGVVQPNLPIAIQVPGEIERFIETCDDGLCARVRYDAEVLLPDAQGEYEEQARIRRYHVERSLKFFLPDGHYRYEIINITEY